MNTNVFVTCKTWLFVFIFFLVGVMDAGAEIRITDSLSVSGYIRQMLGIHAAQLNPNNAAAPAFGVGQECNNRISLSRTQFQTEWTFKPTDTFKLFANIRFIYDQTDLLENDLKTYDAFPLSTPHYGSTLRAGHDDNVMIEVWEIYADLDLGPLWLRMGKQQIVWGEMFGWRIMDCINPLDLSWHFRLEPEEFENIRIPQWSLRAVYKIEQSLLPWLRDFYIEGFYNPGDVSPNILPDPGAPFRYNPAGPAPTAPPSFTEEIDEWGEDQYGIRIGYSIGGITGTLNYLYLYSHDGFLQNVSPPGPPPFRYERRYPQTDIYGMTLNYAFDIPINTVVTFEGKYIADKPYYTAEPYGTPPNLPDIETAGTLNYGIQLQRFTFVLPRPISAMNISVQFNQTIVSGDAENYKFTDAPHNRETNLIDKRKNQLGLNMIQFLWYNQIVASFKVLYNTDGNYLINPGFKYRYGNHWYFDIYANFLGGSDRRAGSFGSTYWADDVYARITYQF